MQKWEYMFVKCERAGDFWKPRNINNADQENWHKGIDLVAFCNKSGSEGWELVTAMVDTIPPTGLMGSPKETSYRLILKRPVA
jgi:hypothetical protein